jgi:hypothetical protein
VRMDHIVCTCGHGLGDHQSAAGCTHRREQFNPTNGLVVEVVCTCTVFRENRDLTPSQ